MFLRNNYFLCKHSLALRLWQKVLQVKQWSGSSTLDYGSAFTVSLYTAQGFNKNRVQSVSWLVTSGCRGTASQQQLQSVFTSHGSHRGCLVTRQFHLAHTGQVDLAEMEKSILRSFLKLLFTTAVWKQLQRQFGKSSGNAYRCTVLVNGWGI